MLYGEFAVQIEECTDELYALLKKQGVKKKEVCATIIDVFSATEKHVTVDDFSALLAKKNIKLSKQLVEVALNTLCACGLAIEIQFEGEEVKRYEHLHPHAHHDHFICLKCKKIIEFSDKQLERLQEGLIFKKGHMPLFHRLEVYGICDACTYTKRKPMPITYAKEGTTVQLCRIKGKAGFKKRLIELGFSEKEHIRIIKNSDFGPIVLEVKGSRFAIGRGQAQHILVYAD